MILNSILGVLFNVLSFFFGFLPALPSLPSDVIDIWNDFLSIVSGGLGLIGNWFDLRFISVCVGVSLALYLFEHSYALTRWILRFLHVMP